MTRSIPPTDEIAFSFVVCISNGTVLKRNLLASPCLGPSSRHEVILVKNCPNAAAGLNFGIEKAESEWVVCVHQDVYLPKGWDRCLARQLREAERQFGQVGIAGVYGVGDVESPRSPRLPLAAARAGWVVDRKRVLRDGLDLPARVATLDELLLVVRRDTTMRFDPDLGFHLYGADICMQASERGLAVVALEALCHHNSASVGLPDAFFASAEVFASKWRRRLPVATPCVIIDRQGRVQLLGNAAEGTEAIAYAIPQHEAGHHAFFNHESYELHENAP